MRVSGCPASSHDATGTSATCSRSDSGLQMSEPACSLSRIVLLGLGTEIPVNDGEVGFKGWSRGWDRRRRPGRAQVFRHGPSPSEHRRQRSLKGYERGYRAPILAIAPAPRRPRMSTPPNRLSCAFRFWPRSLGLNRPMFPVRRPSPVPRSNGQCQCTAIVASGDQSEAIPVLVLRRRALKA